MSFRVLAFSDLHLDDPQDFNVEPLAREIESRSRDEEIDALMSLGDVVDNIPRDRESGDSDPKKDAELGRNFFRDMSHIFQEYGVPTYAVPGNHDHDLFDSIIRYSDGDELPGVFDAREGHTITSDSVDYGIVGVDVSSFDIGPEIDPEAYGIDDLDDFVAVLSRLATSGGSVEQASDRLGITPEDYRDFHRDAERFVESFRGLEEIFDNVYSQARQEDSFFISHIAPFNTELDAKTIGRDSTEHQGSVVTRTAIDYFRPKVALNGHHDYHTLDYFPDEDYGSDIYAVGLDEATPTEIILEDGSIGLEEK